MTQQEGIVKGDTLQKIGSAAFIVAAVFLTVGNLWSASIDLSNPELAREKFSAQIVTLQAMSLLITFGWWSLLAGVAAVQRAVTAAGAAWARLGLYLFIVGTAFWTLGMSLDISYSAMIANWLAAPAASKELAHNLLTTLFPLGLGIGRGIFPMNLMSNWLALGLLGLGMLRSAICPRWLGWFGAILGILGVLLGIIMTFTGREAIFILFTMLAFLTVAWILMCGVWMARRAW